MQALATTIYVLQGVVCKGQNNCNTQTGICKRSGEILPIENSGTIVAFQGSEIGYQNRLGQTKYRKIDQCKNLTVKDLDASHEEPITLLETAESLATGDKVAFQGGKRLKPGMSTLASMPQGDVLLPKDGILLALSELSSNEVVKMQVIDADSGKTVFDISNPKSPKLINANYLQPGNSYNWLVRTRDKSYQGIFRVMEPEYQQEIESELLTVLKNSHASPMGELMMRAAIYHEYGLSYDRDRILSEVRTMNERR